MEQYENMKQKAYKTSIRSKILQLKIGESMVLFPKKNHLTLMHEIEALKSRYDDLNVKVRKVQVITGDELRVGVEVIKK